MKPTTLLFAAFSCLTLTQSGCQNGPRALRSELEQTRAELAQIRSALKDMGGPSLKTPDASTFEIRGEVFVNDKTGPRVVGAAEILVYEKEAFEKWLAKASREVVDEVTQLQSEVASLKTATEEAEKLVRELHEKQNKRGLPKADLEKLTKEYEIAQEARNKTSLAHYHANLNITNRNQNSALFSKLPPPAFRTESDSLGKFALSLPSGKSFVLASRTTQQFSSEDRLFDQNGGGYVQTRWNSTTYTWFMPVVATDSDRQIALTSSNTSNLKDGKLIYSVNRR